LDLTGVEALSDLIAAETDAQRRQALGGVEGRIRDECIRWRATIQSFRASIEAELDFSDQEDVLGADQPGVERQLGIASLVGEMRALRGQLEAAEIVRRGFRVAIIGAPNAGKSSLINALAMRDVAIVTPEPGTTRDLVETTLDLGGYKVLVTDTAGIREGQSEAEKIGIARARQSAETADLVLLVSAPDVAPVEVAADGETIRLGTKADLGRVPGVDVSVSVYSGEGISQLVELIGLRAAAGSVGAAGLPVRERHVGCIDRAIEELEAAMAESRSELAAEHLRLAAMEIGGIVGIGDTETLLGEIFSRFCIGK
jgi:tRNA modification GTPase